MIGFAEMLVDAGIDSVSLNPDSVLKVRQRLARHEGKMATKILSGFKHATQMMTQPKQASAQ